MTSHQLDRNLVSQSRLHVQIMPAALTLFSLPYEIRVQIWQLVLGPSDLQPCTCVARPHPCRGTLSSTCMQDFNLDETCDNRILRVCREICDEVKPMVLRSPKIFTVCNGVCLDGLLGSIPSARRAQFRRVTVRVYIGGVKEQDLRGLKGAELLTEAESWCGPFVQMALKNHGVSEVETADLVGDVEVDEKLRRTVWVDIRLKGPVS